MEGEEPAPASTPPPEASGADYAQWAAAMQAYYKASPSASMGAFYGAGVPHPYSAWGGQPMLPYGAPSPYFPGGVFPHSVGAGVGGYPGYAPPASSGAPASAEAVRPRATSGSLDVDRDAAGDKIKTEDTGTKQPEGKAGGSNGNGNGARESASGDSGSDDGTSGSKGTQVGIGGRKRSLADLADVSTPGSAGVGSAGGGAFSAAGAFAAAGAAAAAVAAAAASAPAGQAAADYWRRQAAAASVPPPEYAAVAAAAAAGVSGMDEREVKRQRRKQSNRESARRSRLRKQAECEELGTKVGDLHGDNARLRAELSQYMALVEQLQAEKKILEEQVRSSGGDPASALAQLPRPAAAFKAEEDAAAAAAAALAGKAAGGGVKEEGAAVAAAS